ncbi:hypothetical protein IFM89_025407 [Coptis chinensis]|uniref:F-box domain-containing protein n=1 Tax=Coptis chinensis TaxID=261450 RepID=A0A835LIJ6_9MAGN|nr:hypothetical protein IFM89_025407 [Coptis chinensis]
MKEGKYIEALPDEMWIEILEAGIRKLILEREDICSFSMCCKRFNNLSNDNIVWSTLVARDFPRDILSKSIHWSSKKALYIFILEMYIKLERLITRETVLSTKLELIQREVEVMTEQIVENAGDFNMIIDRHFACCEEVDNMKQEHMHIKSEVSLMQAEFVEKHGGF